MTVIDRRLAPGGHWLDAYPFVRLHTPSAYYGVNSLPLGEDRIDDAGENRGSYERATGEEVREHFAEAAARLTRTGRVRILTGQEHLGRGADGEQVRDLRTGRLHEVVVRRKVVDARYLEASVPSTHTPSFQVSPDVRFVAVNDLPAARSASSYTVLGSGKTAVDACTWLLDNHVEPDRIRWIRPREAWFLDRAAFQPLEQVGARTHPASPSFNAAVIGFVEAHRDDEVDKNRLCPPNPYARSIEDWPRLMRVTWAAEYGWGSEPDVSAWVAQSRLNLLRALPEHAAEPSVQTSLQRFLTHVGPAIERLGQRRETRSGELASGAALAT